jgi:Glycerophosphoryl diester phosphodiesterase
MQKAAAAGYWMIETDLRVTKDGELITHHDVNLKRTFGLDSAITSMTWEELSKLKNKQGYQIQKFEDVLKFCKGKLGVMIDNKIRGNDTLLWNKVLAMLKKYKLNDSALMIGTDESTEFFTGKIRLSCTRKQLEENSLKPGYRTEDYFLFSGNLSEDDVKWGEMNHILTIGVINAWPYRSADIDLQGKQQADALKQAGVVNFQIDSYFEKFLK